MTIEEIDEYRDIVNQLVREKDRMFYDLAIQINNQLGEIKRLLEDIRQNTGVRISPS